MSSTGYLVVGSGISGLSAAIMLAKKGPRGRIIEAVDDRARVPPKRQLLCKRHRILKEEAAIAFEPLPYLILLPSLL